MKNIIKITVLLLVTLSLFVSCGNDLHNGTQMNVTSVTVTGLPTNTYTDGAAYVFSFKMNDGNWVHDTASWSDAKYRANVVVQDGTGSLTFTFGGSPIVITGPQLQFLIIDYPGKTWDSCKITDKIEGKSGNDVKLDNTWTGAANPVTVTGVVSGVDVEWTINK